jgi:hypothetical protein
MSLSLDQKLANLAFFFSLFHDRPDPTIPFLSACRQVESLLWLQLGCQTEYFERAHVEEALQYLEPDFVKACVAIWDSDVFSDDDTQLLVTTTAFNDKLDHNLVLERSHTFDSADDALTYAFQSYMLLAREFADEHRETSFLWTLRVADDARWAEILNKGSSESGLTSRDVVLATVGSLQFLNEMHEISGGDQGLDSRVREIQRWKLDLTKERTRRRFLGAIGMVRERATEQVDQTSQVDIEGLWGRQIRMLFVYWSGKDFSDEFPVELGRPSKVEGELETTPLSNLLQRSIDDLELSVRSYHVLANLKISTISDLVKMSPAELLHRGAGKKSLAEITERLRSMGLSLKGTDEIAEARPERAETEFEGTE